MRWTRFVLGMVGTIALNSGAFCADRPHSDFSGIWVLDKERTRNLPSRLESYTLVVAQNEKQLAVVSKLEGDFRPPEREPGEGFPGGLGGGGFPGAPGRGFPGGAGGGGNPPRMPRGGSPGGGARSGLMALVMAIPSATYSLDGKETTAELGDRMRGTATLKAKWVKDGKALELAAVRQVGSQENSRTLTTKESWRISEDGKVLTVHRKVQTPRGTEGVELRFKKEHADGANVGVQ